LALLTPLRMGQPDVEIGDETPTPRKAARRLAQFVDEVRVVREPPLIASPPRQRARARRPLSINSQQLIMPNDFLLLWFTSSQFSSNLHLSKQISKINRCIQLVANVTKKVVVIFATPKAWPEWLYILGPNPTNLKHFFKFFNLFLLLTCRSSSQ
jgi:hypothetical protein